MFVSTVANESARARSLRPNRRALPFGCGFRGLVLEDQRQRPVTNTVASDDPLLEYHRLSSPVLMMRSPGATSASCGDGLVHRRLGPSSLRSRNCSKRRHPVWWLQRKWPTRHFQVRQHHHHRQGRRFLQPPPRKIPASVACRVAEDEPPSVEPGFLFSPPKESEMMSAWNSTDTSGWRPLHPHRDRCFHPRRCRQAPPPWQT